MGIGGTPVAIPEVGKFTAPGVLYTARCRFGFGTTDYSTSATDSTGGGASDGCHVWTDTALAVALFKLTPIASQDTAWYDDTTVSEAAAYGGILVHTVHAVVKTAFAGLSAGDIGDCTDSDGWIVDSDIVVGTTDFALGGVSSAITKPAQGLARGKGARLYATTDVADNLISIHPTGDATAGVMDVYLVYSLVDERALATTSWPDTLGGA